MTDTAASPPAVVIPLDQEASQSAGLPQRIEIPITVPSTQPCDGAPTDEIVVCAPDSAVYRIGAVPAATMQTLPKAEVKLGDKAALAAQLQAGNVGHMRTNRAMVTVKVAF